MDGVGARTALILYGTETGTAQDIAEELGQVTERLRFATRVAELDTVALTDLPLYTITVFVVSTTGQGEFPSDARAFWTSLLRKRLSPSLLRDVSFYLVGLGDSSYPKFNWAARKLGKRLEQLGASEIIESCEADEQGPESTDGAFMAWLPLFKTALLQHPPLPAALQPIPDEEALPSKVVLQQCAGISANGDRHGASWNPKHVPFAAEAPSAELFIGQPDHDHRPVPEAFRVTLQENDRVTPISHWQDVRLLTLTTEKNIQYLPGDAISILPKNFPEDVDALIHQMDWTSIADRFIKFNSTSSPSSADPLTHPSCPIPSLSFEDGNSPPFTLRSILTNYLDITAIPRRSFFSRLASYTNNTAHKERLVEFTLPEYLDEYYDYATRARRSIMEILQEFDSVQIPWWEAANVFPPLRGRAFSIASGGTLKHGSIVKDGQVEKTTRFELLIAIVEYRTVIKKTRRGVCTRYLASLSPGSTLNVVLKTDGRFFNAKKSTKPTNSSSTSVATAATKAKLLIGAGTGIAPLRAIITHDDEQRALRDDGTGPTTLIFGARNHDKDFFFKEEWEARVQHGQHQNGHIHTKDPATTSSSRSSSSSSSSSISRAANTDQTTRQHHTQTSRPKNPPFHLITAFSRDHQNPKINTNTNTSTDTTSTDTTNQTTHPAKKTYIQDRLLDRADTRHHIFDMLVHQQATVVVCGSSGAMPRAVRQALMDVLVWRGQAEADEGGGRNGSENGSGSGSGGQGKWTTESAKRFLDGMEKEGRYLQETW